MAPTAVIAPNDEAKRNLNLNPNPNITMQGGADLPGPPKFSDPLKLREYLKFRLAQAFRIFGI